MNDKQIIESFMQRSEAAISQTEHKYEKYCYRIAHNILRNAQDSVECVNDAYLRAWNAISSGRFPGIVPLHIRHHRTDGNGRFAANKGKPSRITIRARNAWDLFSEIFTQARRFSFFHRSFHQSAVVDK